MPYIKSGPRKHHLPTSKYRKPRKPMPDRGSATTAKIDITDKQVGKAQRVITRMASRRYGAKDCDPRQMPDKGRVDLLTALAAVGLDFQLGNEEASTGTYRRSRHPQFCKRRHHTVCSVCGECRCSNPALKIHRNDDGLPAMCKDCKNQYLARPRTPRIQFRYEDDQ